MSRALNVQAEHAHVLATCAKHKTPISAIEKLLSGGTRVVLMNSDDAATIRHAYRTKLIGGAIRREAWVRNA
jgi:hypothetical protein